MIRVSVVVKGKTEEGFVKQMLYPYLFEKKVLSRMLWLEPAIFKEQVAFREPQIAIELKITYLHAWVLCTLFDPQNGTDSSTVFL